MSRFIRPITVFLSVVALSLACASAAQARQKATGPAPRTIVVKDTLAAAAAQPRVHVQIGRGRQPLTAPKQKPARGEERKRDSSFLAYLDTATSGFLISRETADRFGIKAAPRAVYHEVGLHGPTKVEVSRIYGLALADVAGPQTDAPSSSFKLVQREAALQISTDRPQGPMALMGPIDVVGMPAIRRVVVEIVPPEKRGMCPVGMTPEELERMIRSLYAPDVVIHPAKTRVNNVDIEIVLEYIDYNQKNHPGNSGMLPTLDSNPTIPGVKSTHAGRTFDGVWLFDTGAAASIISTAHAAALGLVDASGAPTRAPDFTLPLGGVSGTVKPAPGFVIDSLRIPAMNAKTLEFRDAHVVVMDVGYTTHAGQKVVLDGVLGMNFLLDSASGLELGLASKSSMSPFRRIWIDGPHARLGLQLR